MTNMSADKAGNSLLQLPQEIKNEIYSHYFNKSYLVLWSLLDADSNKSIFWTTNRRIFSEEEEKEQDFESRSLFPDVSDSKTRDLADFAILRTCKSINSDAQDILYSTATTFIYVMCFGCCATYTTPPAREATDRMMNVEFRVRIYRDSPTVWSLLQGTYDREQHQLFSEMEATCRPTLDRFAGRSVLRDSFRIRLEISSLMCNDSIRHLIESHFFETLKTLTGFKRVTVGLISSVLAGYATDSEARETVRTVQEVFEVHLGPSIARVEDSAKEMMKNSSVDIEFEPRKFHLKKLRASKL